MKKNKAISLILAAMLTVAPIQSYAENDFNLLTKTKSIITELAEGTTEMFKNIVNKFSDMGSHWADITVGKLVDLGVLNGYEDGTFRPDNTITRAEFSKTVRTALRYDLKKGNSFGDTSSHWAKDDIYTLAQNGVIDTSEYGNDYEPNKNITRIEMAKMMVRAAGLDSEAKAKVNQNTSFADNGQIKASDRGYVIIASEKGIINGYPDKTFRPNKTATRAEASQMIINLYEALDNGTNTKEVEYERTKEGYVKADDLEKQSFESLGYDFDNQLFIKDFDGSYIYKADKIIQAKKNMLPIQFGNIVITDIKKVPYEKTPYCGDTSIYFRETTERTKDDSIILEGYAIKSNISKKNKYAISSLRLGVLNKKGEFKQEQPLDIDKSMGNVYYRILEQYPNYPKGDFPKVDIKTPFTAMFISDNKLENIDKIFLMDQYNSTDDVLEINFNEIEE